MPLPKKTEKKETGIWKTEDGRFLLDVRPGRGSAAVRKICKTLGDARKEKTKVLSRYHSGEKELVAKRDKRRLSELCQQWFDLHGHTLATGEARLKILLMVSEKLGNPVASNILPPLFLDYRKQRLESGISKNNLNHELVYFKSVFNELERAGQWTDEKPFNTIKKFRLDDKELRFLSLSEINQLLMAAQESINPDLVLMIKLGLSTGARIGELEKLKPQHFSNGMVTFVKTKNGRRRTVPIDDALKEEVLADRPRTERFNKSQYVFEPGRRAFANAIERADISLPDGQMTHVLRHTFASHFMMNGGDLLVLNKILGHQTIQMTMTYAHLAPSHLADAKKYNPLTKLFV